MSGRRSTVYMLISAALIIGLLTGRTVFFSVAYGLALVFCFAFIWAQVAIGGITIQRMTRSRRSQVGYPFQEGFKVRNQLGLPKFWLEVRDYSELPHYRAGQIVPPLWGVGKSAEHQWQAEVICVARGEYQLGPMSVSTGDPFGLFQPTRRIVGTQSVIIYPAVVPIRNIQLPMGALTGGEAQRKITQNITTNAAGVRDYVSGDSINRIHWRTTARRGQLTVKEFELDPQVDMWLFVDFSVDSLVEDESLERRGRYGTVIPSGQVIPNSTEEYAAVIAASIASHYLHLRRAMGFTAYIPHREVYEAARGEAQRRRILEALAIARSRTTHSLAEMLSNETHYLARGTTLIIVTSAIEPSWVGRASVLKRKGVRPLVVYIDPSSFLPNYSGEAVKSQLQNGKIPTIVIRRGDDLASALAQRPL